MRAAQEYHSAQSRIRKPPLATNRSNSNETSESEPKARYKCGICMSWLNEPVITTCGHRFCKSCLNSWLRNKSQSCPMDHQKIATDKDIFPDNYTRREIQQIKLKCENNKLGCKFIASPLEMERHKFECPYRTDQLSSEEKCPFASIKCDFVGRSETNDLEIHLKQDMTHHLQLMLRSLQDTAISTWTPQKPAKGQIDAARPSPAQQANGGGEKQLIQAMNQRIVELEQRISEKNVKMENLHKQLINAHNQINAHYSNGTIEWKITNFRQLMDYLRSNTNNLLYSHECYTSPYGYKFCARLNVQPTNPHFLSLHVHLMQSENDVHLEWPFKGRINMSMVHPRDKKMSQHDTIKARTKDLAFNKPKEHISAKGFGFVEYANIGDIIKRGFCEDDRLLIKIQINLV